MARTAGVLTELRVRRGSRVEKGDVIAVLSDEAREAQVTQARALVEQRKIELDAKRRLIELNAVPRLELSSLEAQHKSAVAALAVGGGGKRPRRDQGAVVRRRHRTDQRGRRRGVVVHGQGVRPIGRSRSDAGGGRSVGAQAPGREAWPDGRDAAGERPDGQGQGAFRLAVGEPDDTHLSRRDRDSERGFLDPRRHYRRGFDPARRDAGYAYPAFGADLLVGRPARRAYRQCGEPRRVRRHHSARGRPVLHVGRRPCRWRDG